MVSGLRQLPRLRQVSGLRQLRRLRQVSRRLQVSHLQVSRRQLSRSVQTVQVDTSMTNSLEDNRPRLARPGGLLAAAQVQALAVGFNLENMPVNLEDSAIVSNHTHATNVHS